MNCTNEGPDTYRDRGKKNSMYAFSTFLLYLL
jgi:hypothetical protein